MTRTAIAAIVAILSFAAGGARAQTCGVSATAAAFGTYSPTAAQPTDTTASVSISCRSTVQVLVAYSLSMSPGQGSGFGARVLRSGSYALGYQLYSNALRSAVWGDGTGGTVAVTGGAVLSALAPLNQVQTAYGRIPARQNVGPGAYMDTVLVTVVW